MRILHLKVLTFCCAEYLYKDGNQCMRWIPIKFTIFACINQLIIKQSMETKEITVKGRKYEIQFPNVGQYYQIEVNKQRLGKGSYNSLIGNPTITAQRALDMIDVEATLSVLCPQLVADLKVKSFSELGLKDFKEISDIYMNEVFPFLKEAEKILSSVD